jgi:hypothetical protein
MGLDMAGLQERTPQRHDAVPGGGVLPL